MIDLSILIPARNEEFLGHTVRDILAHAESDFEIIVVLDGAWPAEPIQQHERVTVLYYPESIGQRAACNRAAAIARGKYVMKCDAHCAFDQGFDVKLMANMQDNWTVVPIMRNLHVFNWVCPNGHRRYQGPSGDCKECGEPTTKDIVWIAKTNPQSTSYCFNSEPHFQYFNEYKKRQEYQSMLAETSMTETMSLQGSCWMMARDKYFELGMNDEAWGSWGSQGIEVACRTWLSGGRVMVNHNTWYAHMFRTSGGDFGFPYTLSGKQVDYAKQMARETFFKNAWEKQVHPLSWLIEKFSPVPGWSSEELERVKGSGDDFSFPAQVSSLENGQERVYSAPPATASASGIVYYTDNRLDKNILAGCQRQLLESAGNLPIVSVSLTPIKLGKNITVPLKRGYLTMFLQILMGLEEIDTDIVFFAEHDILYHPSHFEFIPPDRNMVYYNTNVWHWQYGTDKFIAYTAKRTSQLCAYRDVLIEHYRRRVDLVSKNGFTRGMGFEPGSHRRAERVDDLQSDTWESEYPNIDIKHGLNLTPARWNPAEFRSQHSCQNWREANHIDAWDDKLRRMIDGN